MRKRLISLILILTLLSLCLAFIGCGSIWDDFWDDISKANHPDFYIDGYGYKIRSSAEGVKSVIFCDYEGTASEITVPDTVTYENEEYSVTSMGPIVRKGINSTNHFLASHYCLSITVGKNVDEIDFECLYSNACTDVNIDETNPYFTSIDGVVYSKDGKSLLFYPAGKTQTSFTIPNGVQKICSYAFNLCPYLNELQIAGTVTEIQRNAIDTCTKIMSIYIPSSVLVIDDSAFLKVASDCRIYCQAESKPIDWSEHWNRAGGTLPGYSNVVWGYTGE